MAKYIVTVPPTMDQGSYKFNVSDACQTVAKDALQDYNSSRARDGQEPLKRMPNGTAYTRMYEYDIQGYYGAQYGYECVTTEETYREAKDQLKCYRENDPGTSFKIVTKGL